MVALGLGVPLRRVVHEGVKFTCRLLILYLFQHAIFLLKWFVFIGFTSGLVYAWYDDLGLAQLPNAAGHVLVLDGHVLIPDAGVWHLMHVLGVFTIIIKEIAFFSLIRPQFPQTLLRTTLILRLFTGYQEVSCFIKRTFLRKEHSHLLIPCFL